jgi:hypothetical protein
VYSKTPVRFPGSFFAATPIVKRNQKRATGWSAPLARPVGVNGGPELRTLADARAYVLTLPELDPRWQSVARKLLIACQDGQVEAVTRQLEFALFVAGKLVLR